MHIKYSEMLEALEELQKQMADLREIEQESSDMFIRSILNELREAYNTIDALVECAKEKEKNGSANAKFLQ